ncbi:hypothetical protein GCM10010912_48410 [Paenibacillus albidus]|uniref:Uncharacterized protein n=1 Tax=Paenibacillus albidus TaxID=2041023 RepID=A0A917CUF3_9BACL|nr:hypothetical protein GCM10010912_48410 [Paenibacillus albidus]
MLFADNGDNGGLVGRGLEKGRYCGQRSKHSHDNVGSGRDGDDQGERHYQYAADQIRDQHDFSAVGSIRKRSSNRTEQRAKQ